MPSESVYLPLIRQIAHRLLRRMPESVEFGELVSDGFIGLRQAMQRYDPARKVPFKRFAAMRIYGAMLDGLRERDPLPRQIPTAAKPVPMFLPLIESIPAPPTPDQYESNETARELLALVPRRRRLILHLYYMEKLSLKQIGICLGMSEARASILRKKTIAQLRTNVQR